MKILALIPARGGSKSIPRKNIKLIAGKPLIEWTIEAALCAEGIESVVVSTEDAEIAAIARRAGARLPFERPAELAADETPGIAPVLHAIETLPGYDAVLVLQPTSPLRGREDIEGILAMAEETGAGSIVSITEAAHPPQWMYLLQPDGLLEPAVDGATVARRQDAATTYNLNGAMYYIRVETLLRERRLLTAETLGFMMPPERSVDIDTPFDWRIAESLLATPFIAASQ